MSDNRPLTRRKAVYAIRNEVPTYQEISEEALRSEPMAGIEVATEVWSRQAMKRARARARKIGIRRDGGRVLDWS